MTYTTDEVENAVYTSETETQKQRLENQNTDRLSDNPTRVIVTDGTDADGLTSAVLYKTEFGENCRVLYAGYNAPQFPDVTQTIKNTVKANPDAIYISDLGPQKEWVSELETYDGDISVFIRDHHRVSGECAELIEGIDFNEYIQGDDDKYCAAELVMKNDVSKQNLNTRKRKLVGLTSITDLNKTNSDRFERANQLENASRCFSVNKYVSLGVNYGSVMLSLNRVQRTLEQWSTLEVEKDEFVRERVDVQTVSGVTVAFAIGDCRQGVLPYTILDECSDVDLVVVVKPSGKMSLKCRTGLDIAKRVAVELGGGGHSTRAGATYDGTVQMPDARDVKQHICEAIQTVSE